MRVTSEEGGHGTAKIGLRGWIRTSDIFLPREVGYQAALHTDSKGPLPTLVVIGAPARNRTKF